MCGTVLFVVLGVNSMCMGVSEQNGEAEVAQSPRHETEMEERLTVEASE